MKPVALLVASSFAVFALAQSQSWSGWDALAADLLYRSFRNSSTTTSREHVRVRRDIGALSHVVGVVQPPATALVTGPDSGAAPTSPNTWTLELPSSPVPDTKYLILHFTEVSLPGNNRLEVDLGYDTDIFRAGDGPQFWTRPINTKALAGAPVLVRYITDGSTTGRARLDRIGRGERHAGTLDPTSLSNSDPFFTGASYLEPKYDPFWYCTEPPSWENVACVEDPADVRARVARSVGMIISPEGEAISTCSVTLIDSDQVITAGHCHTPEEAIASSITFDYQTDCAGNRLPGYNPRFFKVKEVLNHRYDGFADYSRLRLATAPPGVPPLQLRPDLPGAGEAVFGIHHPNGAVKKLSVPHPNFASVVASSASSIDVPANFHVSGGSSGSGLFDAAGRVLGVLSTGNPCGRLDSSPFPLSYFPSSSILKDIAPAPPTPVTRDVMIVFDRSGSMAELESTGRTKIEVARDAVSLFVQLVRSGVGNRVGLVSFSTAATSPVDFARANVEPSSKQALIGPAPYAGGIVGSLVPRGATSIGDGLDQARLQLTPAGANPRAILLMTDGMENTPPLVGDVEGALAGIDVHAVGFGTDANLDSLLLGRLTSEHQGLYTRAETGVSLQKFFSHAFGNIFETGILQDPEYDLPANQQASQPLEFSVCAEDTITVVVGWDDVNATLRVNLTSPGGARISGSSLNVEESVGRTWTFLRVPLPYGGEREGKWNATVFRPGEETPPILTTLSLPPLHYFIDVIPTGGPRLRRAPDRRPYYTGDTINPLVFFNFPDGSWPDHAQVQLTLSRPNASIGTTLSRAGLQAPVSIAEDTIPARQATLRDLAASARATIEETFELSAGPADTEGSFEEAGKFGKRLVEKLVTDGDYLLHFRARTEGDCTYTRELLSSLHVDVGIDPSRTDISTNLTDTGPDGQAVGSITITPRDRYGNELGPGRSGAIDISGGLGTVVTGPVVDNGDGSYTVPIRWDPASGNPPGIVIGQPGRSPVVAQQAGVCNAPGKCPRCIPHPGQNQCESSTSACSNTPFGTMCACRPGYKADAPGAASTVHWRLKWPNPGHEHRVYVAPGQKCDTLCDKWFLGAEGCQEVDVKEC